ncbi:MAG: hypothetical protein ACTSUB_07415 [Candidatus Thorarchaeota archaeon]
MELLRIIGKTLANQFDNAWSMLNQAIENIPDELWSKNIGDWYFSMTAYHIIESANFYSGKTPDGMQWGFRAGFDWKETKNMKTDILPLITKDLVLLYLSEIKTKLSSTLNTVQNDVLQGTDGFHWFRSILEKLLYLQRHTMLHIGELYLALRTWDCKRGTWC